MANLARGVSEGIQGVEVGHVFGHVLLVAPTKNTHTHTARAKIRGVNSSPASSPPYGSQLHLHGPGLGPEGGDDLALFLDEVVQLQAAGALGLQGLGGNAHRMAAGILKSGKGGKVAVFH